MRDHDGFLTFAPRLPARLDRLSFLLRFRGRQLKVEARGREATYTLLAGDVLELSHHGERITVMPGEAVTQTIRPLPERPAPSQPPGREPQRRGTEDEAAV